MALRVDIARLQALANNLDNLQKDIRSQSDNAASAADSVLSRTSGQNHAPLIAARNNALKSLASAKALYVKICSRLSQQSGTLRDGAVSYRREDKITTVN